MSRKICNYNNTLSIMTVSNPYCTNGEKKKKKLIKKLKVLKSPKIPFFIRPITAAVAKRIDALFVFPNAQKHLDFLDGQLSRSSGGGEAGFLCGDGLTAADILMSFPLQLARERFPDVAPGPGRAWKDGSPLRAYGRVFAYLDRLEAIDSYKRAMRRIDEFGADAKKG